MEPSIQIPFLTALSFDSLMSGLFYLILLAFLVHAVIVIYHWHTFGTERSIATTATIIYLGVGAVIIMFTLLMLNSL